MIRSVANYSERTKGLDNKYFIIGALMGAVGNLFNAGMQSLENRENQYWQERQNKINQQFQMQENEKNRAFNREINQQNLDFSKAMTESQWERDDNAHQREVADLQSAGLSPLVATGGAPNATPVSSGPMVDSSEGIAPQGVASRFRAPQIDVNSMLESVYRQKELQEKIREFDTNAKYKGQELSLTAQSIQNMSRQIDVQDNEVNRKIVQDSNNYFLAVQQLQNAKEEIKIKKYEANTKQFHEVMYQLSENNKLMVEQMSQAQKDHLRCRAYFDYDSYNQAMNNYGKRLETFLASKGISRIGEISAHFGAGSGDRYGASGINFGGGYKPNSFREEKLYKQFQSENPFPVFVYGWRDYTKMSNVEWIK